MASQGFMARRRIPRRMPLKNNSSIPEVAIEVAIEVASVSRGAAVQLVSLFTVSQPMSRSSQIIRVGKLQARRNPVEACSHEWGLRCSGWPGSWAEQRLGRVMRHGQEGAPFSA